MRKQLCFFAVCCSLVSSSVPATEALAGPPGRSGGAAEEAKPEPYQSVSWTTPDGVYLVALYHPRESPGHLVWVLLHGLGSSKQEWLKFVRKLAQQGDGFLIYDARGHGNSVHRTSGGKIDYRDFRTVGQGSQWDLMTGDVESAVQVLIKRFSLNAHGIAVGGASLGANVALVYASQHPEVPALVLLSPGLQYAGVGSEEPFRRYGTRPVFIAASPGDDYAYASVRQLISQRSDPNCRAASGEGAAHGVNMFNDVFTKKLLDWMASLDSFPPGGGR
jgi:pimeloyl-ACP methyl ester carboxylesterase